MGYSGNRVDWHSRVLNLHLVNIIDGVQRWSSSIPSLPIHAPTPQTKRWSLFALPLNLGWPQWLCLTNLIYYVEFPRLGQKQPCCSLLGWFALGTVLLSNQPLSCKRPRPHKEAMWRHWLTAPAELPAYSQCQLLPTLRKPFWMSGLAKPTEDSWLQMHGRPQVRLTQINTINSQNHER